MKGFTKLLALVLACLLLIGGLVACGDDPEVETNGPSKETSGSDQPGAETDAPAFIDDSVPKDLRFDGETVTFLVRNNHDKWLYEMDVDTIMNDTLFDAIYYRNKTVEERLGVIITTIAIAGNYGDRSAWNDTVRTAVNTKLNDYDSAAIYMSTGSVLAVENVYYNVLDFDYIDLDKPWWNATIRDELTLFDTLYYLAGDIAITETAGGNAMFYNKDLLDKYFAASNLDLYAEVENQAWTIDRLYDLAAQVHEDVNADGIVSDGDIVGYQDSDVNNISDGSRDAWIAAMGISLTSSVNGVPEFTFYSSRTVEAFEKIKNLLTQNPGALAKSNCETTRFSNGTTLFMRGELNTGSTLREMKDRYGVLPLPMFEENQDGGYRTVCTNNCSLVTILSSLPADRKDLVGATIELMAAESYRQVRPAYFEVALKSKYSEDPNDAKMYDVILNSFTFSFGYCYSTESLGGIGSLFRDLSADIAEKWDSNNEMYEEKLTQLIDGLDEAAFKAMYGN